MEAMIPKKIQTSILKKYIYINIGRLIIRKVLSCAAKIIFQVEILSFKKLRKIQKIKNKKIYILAPGKSLDNFQYYRDKESIYIGISKVISHKINCDFYMVELRFYNLIKYIRESLKKLEYHKPKAFIMKGYCSPTTILPSLIFIFLMKFYRCKVYLISEIYNSDFTNKPKFKFLNLKVFLENMNSFILLGRTYWDFKFVENFTDKLIFVGFDKTTEYASQCDWEGNFHKYYNYLDN